MRDKGFRPKFHLSTREQIWDLIGEHVGNRIVLYLEFGVWQGQATRYFAKLLHHPQAMLHGFDSFQGLPERWNIDADVGAFSTGGTIPSVDDHRVRFHEGWFHETLPRFRLPRRDVLVINLDADLYSSTICALNCLRDAIEPGTYLYFDEFSDPVHELRAFDEFLGSTDRKFELLAATPQCDKMLFRCRED